MPIVGEYAASARLVVVDDEQANIKILRRVLTRAGYQHIRATADPREVESIISDFAPDMLLLDLHMPHLDGFGVLKALGPRLRRGGHFPVLMLTGDKSPEALRGALSLGAKDFVSKPFDAEEVLLRIHNLLETHFLYLALEKHNALLDAKVKERTRDLQNSQYEIIERLARAAEMRDDDTGRHTMRVGTLSALLAEAFGAKRRFIDLIRHAAPMHDVGKIGIPDGILLKSGRLSEAEFEIMRSHPVIGSGILAGGRSELLLMAERIALSHHERWDGNGYPNRLKEDGIPLEARIVALADAFDALSHHRRYRAAWRLEDVLAEIRSESGRQFDPSLVTVMMESRCYEPMLQIP